MTFSSLLKKDLGKLPLGSKACQQAELSGIIGGIATIAIDQQGEMALSIKTENPNVAARYYLLLKTLFKIKAKIKIEKTKKFRDHRDYLVSLDDSEEVKKILLKLKILLYNQFDQAFFSQKVPKNLVKSQAQKKAYIRGVFLACGSVSNPEKTYHLELVEKKTTAPLKRIKGEGESGDQCTYLQSVKDLLESFEIKANLIHRKIHWVLYLKEGESVINFLNVIGGYRGLLEMENIRIVKEMRNDVNRQVNCETANLNKTVAASCDQIESILFLKEKLGLKSLPENLYEVAEIRLNYPNDSIKELGERLNPPVGKSGVYHRLKKLNQLAKDLRLGS